jgi:hypothetical protein
MDIISGSSNYLHVLLEFFFCFTHQLHIVHVKKCDILVLVVCSSYPVFTCSTALWGGLSKCTIAMVIKSLLELLHIVFLYHLFILDCCRCSCWVYVPFFLLQIFYALVIKCIKLIRNGEEWFVWHMVTFIVLVENKKWMTVHLFNKAVRLFSYCSIPCSM